MLGSSGIDQINPTLLVHSPLKGTRVAETASYVREDEYQIHFSLRRSQKETPALTWNMD
jgi:hypothetical protein